MRPLRYQACVPTVNRIWVLPLIYAGGISQQAVFDASPMHGLNPALRRCLRRRILYYPPSIEVT